MLCFSKAQRVSLWRMPFFALCFVFSNLTWRAFFDSVHAEPCSGVGRSVATGKAEEPMLNQKLQCRENLDTVAGVVSQAESVWRIRIDIESFELWLSQRNMTPSLDAALTFACISGDEKSHSRLAQQIRQAISRAGVFGELADTVNERLLEECLLGNALEFYEPTNGTLSLLSWLTALAKKRARQLASKRRASPHSSKAQPFNPDEHSTAGPMDCEPALKEAAQNYNESWLELFRSLPRETRRMLRVLGRGDGRAAAAASLGVSISTIGRRLADLRRTARPALEAKMRRRGHGATTLNYLVDNVTPSAFPVTGDVDAL